MVRTFLLLAAWLACVSFPLHKSVAAETVGGIAQNFSGPYYTNTSKQFRLYDFPNRVLLLEFFWAGCPFCQGAAPYIKSGIVDYYQDQGGNPDGVPVQVVSLLVANEGAATTSFINTYGLDLVVNDLTQTNYTRLGGAGTPHFVVINAVSNSASHATWQIVAIDTEGFPRQSDSQYASKATQRINTLRGYIDSIKAANTPPSLLNPEMLGNGQLRFVLAGQKGRTNRIEATSNWTSWAFITNVVNQTGSVTVTDPGAATTAERYYRAVVQ